MREKINSVKYYVTIGAVSFFAAVGFGQVMVILFWKFFLRDRIAAKEPEKLTETFTLDYIQQANASTLGVSLIGAVLFTVYLHAVISKRINNQVKQKLTETI
jgi:hypothetical protein